MDLKMVIAGLGGEGIIFVTRVLVEGFYQSGNPVISAETHGMAMRGGSVISQVKVGDFQSPFIRYGEADLLVATSADEVQRNLYYLKEDGVVIINTAQPGAYSIDASGIARRLGNARGANLVLLGYALACIAPTISPKPFLKVIKDLTSDKFLPANLRTFLVGWRAALRGNREDRTEEGGDQAARES